MSQPYAFAVLLFFGVFAVAQAQCPTVTIPQPVCAGGNCGVGTAFQVSGDTAGITRYEWIVSRSGGGAQPDTVRGKEPIYSFADPGQYTVTLRITRNGVAQNCPPQNVNAQGIAEFTIAPDSNLGPPEEEICKGTSITLSALFQQGQAPPPGATYLWSRGETTPTITTDSAGCYSVTITDPATGCSRSARVNVRVYKPDPNQPPPPREEARWYFGSGSGIRFVGGQPQPITGNANTPEGTSSISDASGNFLFYTDGRNIFDKAGTPMLDRDGNPVTLASGNGINGGPNSTQAVLIVSQPGCNDCEPVYYVFTTTDIGAGGSQLQYSVVDMRLNNGLGQVTQQNVPLFDTSTERLAAIRAQPDSTNPQRPETTWIVTHDFNSNTFRVYPLTGRGVGSPRTYSVGETHGPATQNGEGYLKVYEDKVVVVKPGAPGEENVVQVFPFNGATGEISGPPNTIRLGTAPPSAYGVELVGDSTLYVSLSGNGTDSSRIVGFNLASGVDSTIANSRRQIVSTIDVIGALQLDPNGQRLFVARQNQNALGEITSPGTLASATYNPNAVQLTRPSQLGLPSSPPPNNQGYGQGFSFSEPQCTPLNTPASITFTAQPDRAGGDPQKSSYAWNFRGVGNSFSQTVPNAGFGVNQTIAVTFPGPGTYVAELTITNDCLTEGPPTIQPQTVVIPLQPPRPTWRDTSNCSSNQILLDPYPGQPDLPGVRYVWITPRLDTLRNQPRTLRADTSGLYTVFVLNDQCQTSGSVRVTYNNLRVNLGRDTTLCGVSTLLLNAGNPGSQYQWFNPANQSLGTGQTLSVTPTSSTYFRVVVTDPVTRCISEDTIAVTVNRRPRISATSTPVTSCDANAGPSAFGSITLNTSADPEAGTYFYRWLQDGGEIPVPPNTTSLLELRPGIYQVIVQRPGGTCDTTLTISIENRSPDAVQFTPTIPDLGCNETTGRIELRRTDGTPGTRSPITYRFLDENGQPPRQPNGQPVAGASGSGVDVVPTLTNLVPGVYRIEGTTDRDNCLFGFVYEVKPPPNKPAVQATFVITGCQTAQLSATGQLANATFQWRREGGANIQTNPDGSATATQSGTYILAATSTLPPRCVTEDTVTINLPTKGEVAAQPTSPACQGGEIRLQAVVTAAYDSYLWVRPDRTQFTGAELVATTPGTYLLIGRNSQTGCSDTVQVTPRFVPLPAAPVVTPPQPICAGGSVPTLVASGQNFRWYSDPGRLQLLSTSPGFRPPIDPRVLGSYTYYVTQSTAEGCESQPTPITVSVIPAPVVNLGPDVQACTGTPVMLNATVNTPGATYRWNNGQTTPTLSVTRAGTYSVQVTGGTCAVFDTVVVAFLPSPRVNIQRREVPLCFSDGEANATLDAGPGNNYTYQWRVVGDQAVIGTERTLTVNNLGLYQVTVNDGGICPSTDTVRVVDKCEPRVFVPEVFTPNNDGRNDGLQVFHAYVGDFRMLIFNRWGEVIFASNSPETIWDGSYLGRPVPPGTYTWKIVYTAQFYPERPEVEIRGGILVLK